MTKPAISVVATDAQASFTGSDTGTFTITRTGATTSPLTVQYALGGTAVNGTDYNLLTKSAIIPAGKSSVAKGHGKNRRRAN